MNKNTFYIWDTLKKLSENTKNYVDETGKIVYNSKIVMYFYLVSDAALTNLIKATTDKI